MMKQNNHNNEALFLLGIEQCKSCGNLISIDAKMCYKCNFNELQNEIVCKGKEFNFHIAEKIYIVVPVNKLKHNPENHLFKSGKPLCNAPLKSYNYRAEAVLTKITVEKFRKNQCESCAIYLDQLLTEKSN